jgi:predicted NBD/HSP70 family sugar kinase
MQQRLWNLEAYGGIMKQPTTGSFELIKNLNTACILNSIRISGQISRADIARGTGLTPATVSNITAEIMELGLIKEMERGESNGGRKPVLISINKTACYFGAIHIGSNEVEAAVADVSASLIVRKSAPIGLGVSPEDTVTLGLQLLEAIRIVAGVKAFAGIGICTHGLVRSSEGVMVFAPNLGWSNVRIGGMVATATGLPVFVENDVRAMALAESWCGFAHGVKDYVYLYIGPGIGGGIIDGNELYKGPCGFAGEFGHVTIDPEGPVCSCGNRGCLQALASETAVLNQYIKHKKLQGETVPENFDFAGVLRAAKLGDEAAREEILKSVRYIGIEVGNIINTLSPSLIVINGRLTEFSDAVMSTLGKEIGRHCMRSSQDSAKIAFSTLGEEAPIRGAATCVIRQMFESPKTFLKPCQK